MADSAAQKNKRKATQNKTEIKSFKGADKTNIDTSINEFKAIEFLCRQREAKLWIEEVSGEKFTHEDFLDNLKDGVLLCKTGQIFAPGVIDKIVKPDATMKFQETDNINNFMRCLTKVGLPKIYFFSVPDLWEKVNVVNVVHCMHSLAHYLEQKGVSISKMKDLTGKVEFTKEEIEKAEKELKEIEERQRLKNLSNIGASFSRACKIKVFKNGDRKKGVDINIPDEAPEWPQFLNTVGMRIGVPNVKKLYDAQGNEITNIDQIRGMEDKTFWATSGEAWVDPNSREVTVFVNGENQKGKALKLTPKPWLDVQTELAQAIGLKLEDYSKIRVFDYEGFEVERIDEIPDEKDTPIYITNGEDWINPKWRGIRVKKNNGDRHQNEVPMFLPDRNIDNILSHIGKELGTDVMDVMKAKLMNFTKPTEGETSDSPSVHAEDANKITFVVKRLFNYRGEEIARKEDIPDKGLVYASAGEDWINPESKPITLLKNGSAHNGVFVRIPPPQDKHIEVIKEEQVITEPVPESEQEKQQAPAAEGTSAEGSADAPKADGEGAEGAAATTEQPAEQAPAEPKMRTRTVIVEKVIETPISKEQQWKQVLNFVAKHSTQENAQRMFSERGQEVFCFEEIEDNRFYYVTAGEDWVDPNSRSVTLFLNGESENEVKCRIPVSLFAETLKACSKELNVNPDTPVTRLFDDKGEEISEANFKEKILTDAVIFASTGEAYVNPKWKNVSVCRNGDKEQFVDNIHLPKRNIDSLKNIIGAKLGMKTKCVKLYNEYGDEIEDPETIEDDTIVFGAGEGEEFTDPFAPNVLLLKNGQKGEPVHCALKRKQWNQVLTTIAEALNMETVAKVYNDTGVEIENRDDIVDGWLLYACATKDEAWIDPNAEPEVVEPPPAPWVPTKNYLFEISDDELSNLSDHDLMRALKAEAEGDDEDSLLKEILRLKTMIVETIRQNNNIEKEIRKIEKKIELLIKNRVSVEEVMRSSKGLFKFLRPKPIGKPISKQTQEQKKKLQFYSNLFYILQTEPKYLAKCIYYVPANKVDMFLETVILSLFGYAFSPREEFLLLSLFQIAIKNEVASTVNVKGFVDANPVVAKMVTGYGRRNQGKQYLSDVLGKLIDPILGDDASLEINPVRIFKEIINAHEQSTGVKYDKATEVNETTAMENAEVRKVLTERVKKLERMCSIILDGLIKNMDQIPYGLRWVCKVMRTALAEKFADASKEAIYAVVGYLLYYRFMNPALVSPDAFGLTNAVISQNARKNLVMVSKVLQNTTNFLTFSSSVEPAMVVMNEFIQSNFPRMMKFFDDVCNVLDPEDNLKVNKYLELTQKNPPQITISVNEIYNTHKILLEYVEDIAHRDEPIWAVLESLGPAPDLVTEEDDDEMQLTLVNKFERNVDEDAQPTNEQIYQQSLEIVRRILRDLPVENFGQNLAETFSTARAYVDEQKKLQDPNSPEYRKADDMDKNLVTIQKNFAILEKEGLIKNSDNYRGVLVAIAKEARNRAQIRTQQRREVERLRLSLDELLKHQKYLKGQTDSYNSYLNQAKNQQSGNKKTGGRLGPFSYSYSQLQKQGVISSLEISTPTTKGISFVVSSSLSGVFDIQAKMAGISVKTVTVAIDDLLEKQYNGDSEYLLDVVKLNINMTIRWLNGLMGKGK